jgi:hypothetical protein
MADGWPMSKKKKFRGQMTRTDSPNWEPLLHLARVYVAEFMWMFEAELEGGVRIHAYKHVITRRYLHLSVDGRAFVYCWPGDDAHLLDDRAPDLYEEVDPRRMIDLVMPCRLDPEEARCPPRRFVDK